MCLSKKSDVRIVGASAWNPKTPSQLGAQSRAQSPIRSFSFSTSAAAALFGEPASIALSFTIITFPGTHIDCVALSADDRDTWLAAIQAGLHISLAGYTDTLAVLAKYTHTNTATQTHACLPLTDQQQAQLQLYEANKLAPPTPRVSEQPLDYTTLHPILHSIVAPTPISTQQDSTIIANVNYCNSCGRLPPEHITARPNYMYGFPMVQYGLENKVANLCYPCLIAQGVLRHLITTVDIYAADAMDRAAFVTARQLVLDHLQLLLPEYTPQASRLQLTEDTSINKIMEFLQTPTFVTFRRQSQRLDQCCLWLERRVQVLHQDHTHIHLHELFTDYVAEYIDVLNQQEILNCSTDKQNIGIMKKEALKVAGDMGTAIKLLYEYAIPHASSEASHSTVIRSSLGLGDSISMSHGSTSTEMFSSILEFFLDLCKEGQLASIAFYWPQICQIHLQMLPPLDMHSLARVELMEDFLITVSTMHSIHLALELTWNCIADLEESLGPNRDSAAPSCRRRKFAVLRFVSELESYIFDFDGGWGGGSVSLRGLFTPSDHQGTLIRSYMGILQMYRQFSRHFLSCSTRLEKLHSEALEYVATTTSSRHPLSDDDSHTHAMRNVNKARHAEYFHSQIMFTRRLGDIAEKLRFMDIDSRMSTLQCEIELLNASGRLGGDPINKITQLNDSLINVLQIPSSECHVFRSKARTPILLLMEVEHERSICTSLSNQRLTEPTETSLKVDDIRLIATEDSDEEEGAATDPLPKIDSQEVIPQELKQDSIENSCLTMIASDGDSMLEPFDDVPPPTLPLTPRRKSFFVSAMI